MSTARAVRLSSPAIRHDENEAKSDEAYRLSVGPVGHCRDRCTRPVDRRLFLFVQERLEARRDFADALDRGESGESRQEAREHGEVVLEHGDLPNLGMPAMTMGFNVADNRMLDRLKEGDKVRFNAEMVKGEATVTYIEFAR